jgi:IS30 family transposase
MSQQLNESHRAILEIMLFYQLPKTQIAQRLKVHRSTVYRELARNRSPCGYRAIEAQKRADSRRQRRCHPQKMNDEEVQGYVCQRLEQRWSPDQIAGRSCRDFRRHPNRQISRQTIYRWVDQLGPPQRRFWRQYLRFVSPRRKSREKVGRLSNTISIEGRPKIVDQRRRFGDWEGDTIVGRRRRGGLVSLVERKSGYTFLARVDNLQADTVRRAAERQLTRLPKIWRHTLTFDNGKEFAEHQLLAEHTGMAIYFARPYAAWQRGTNENTNGLVRHYWPKGTDLVAQSHPAVAALQNSLNDRPRKRLGYLTPREVLAKNALRRSVAFKV